MSGQRTPSTGVKPVTPGQAEQRDQTFQDIVADYEGGADRLELAKGHPRAKARIHGVFDELAREQEARLLFIQRPSFLTRQIGTLETVEAMRQALEVAGIRVSSWSAGILAQNEFAQRIVTVKREVEFVEATAQDFSGGAILSKIYDAARQLNWETCEPSDAIDIAIATLPDQEKDGWRYISMDPGITGSGGCLSLFHVGRGGGALWLNGGRYGDPGRFYYPVHWFVFRRPATQA